MLTIAGLVALLLIDTFSGIISNNGSQNLEFGNGPWYVGGLAAFYAVVGALRKALETATAVEHFVRNPNREAERGWLKNVRRELCKLIRDNTPRGCRLVIFVDDLERCRPPGSVNLLETIHQLLSDAPIVVVVMADIPAVAASAVVKYKELAERYMPSGEHSGHDDPAEAYGRLYIQKLIQLQFDLPDQDVAHIRSLISHSINSDQPDPTAPDPHVSSSRKWHLLNPLIAAWDPRNGIVDFVREWLKLANWGLSPIGLSIAVSLLPAYLVARHAISVGCPKSFRELFPNLKLRMLGTILSYLVFCIRDYFTV